jgi:hypothetical protein
VITTIALYVFWIYATWVLFLAIMNAKAAFKAGKLERGTIIILFPVIVVGYLFDFILNILASVPFLEIPGYVNGDWLLTDRLEYHCAETNWQGSFARWVCHYMLDWAETGGHCHCKH